jgi:hypothetical protein
MLYGKDDHPMWTLTEADNIQRAARERGHQFSCECPECQRTKKIEVLLRRVRL